VIEEEVMPEKKSEVVEPEIIKIEAPEIEGPKILDKIDLSAISSSTRPKKIEPKPQPVEEIIEPEPVKEELPARLMLLPKLQKKNSLQNLLLLCSVLRRAACNNRKYPCR
jgi:hypothetical protein